MSDCCRGDSLGRHEAWCQYAQPHEITADLRSRLQAAEEELERLREALRAAEWHRDDGHGPPQCPVCGGWGDLEGHKSDCLIRAALRLEGGR